MGQDFKAVVVEDGVEVRHGWLPFQKWLNGFSESGCLGSCQGGALIKPMEAV
jgi:hypothetical protein